MTKKTALTVAPRTLRKRVLPNKINNGFNVAVVEENSFGKDLIIKNIENDTGFNCGCKKVIRSDSWFGFQGTAQQSSNELKTIGWSKHPKRPLIMEHASTWSMTVPIFTRTDV
jgi:hypothetical protein